MTTHKHMHKLHDDDVKMPKCKFCYTYIYFNKDLHSTFYILLEYTTSSAYTEYRT